MPSPPRTPYTHLPSQADLFYFCTTFSTSDDSLNFDQPPPSKRHIRLGVSLLGNDDIPSLDLACIDLLAMLTRRRLEAMGAPSHVLELAIELDILFLSEGGDDTFTLTNGVQLPASDSLNTSQQLDVFIFPGVSPYFVPSSSIATLLNSRISELTTTIMTFSTGILPVLHSCPTFLHAKTATAAPSRISSLRQHFPETQWEARRWVNEDRLWSCCGGASGLQMIAAWMREYFWDRSDAVEWVLQETALIGDGRGR